MERTVSSHLSSTELGDSLRNGNFKVEKLSEMQRNTNNKRKRVYQMEYMPGFCCDLEKDFGI